MDNLGNPIYFTQKFNEYDRRLQRIEENLSRINTRLTRPGSKVPIGQPSSRTRPRASKKRSKRSKRSKKSSKKSRKYRR